MPVNEITATKQEFALDLATAGLNVLDYVPERVVPPVVVIAPGSPYLSPSKVNGEWTLNLELTCVAATAVNKQSAEKLDGLVQDLLNAMPGYASVGSVGKPFELAANNASYLATTVMVELLITI